MITHPEKVLFPDDGITKGELAAYYEMIAPLMLPHILRRPVTMERFPAGIAKQGFIQKDVSKGFPDWLQRVDIPKKGGVVHHPIVTDVRSLLWLVNQNCITPHVWTSRAPEVVYPERGHALDRLIGDLKAIRERSRQSIERLAAVDPRGLRWRHFTLGEMDLAQWWLLHVRHEADHLEQLRAVKAAQGFPRS